MLLIKGRRFRLHSGAKGVLDGTFKIYRRRFLVKTQRGPHRLAFLFERRGERFVLLNRSGRALIFDRVPGTARL